MNTDKTNRNLPQIRESGLRKAWLSLTSARSPCMGLRVCEANADKRRWDGAAQTPLSASIFSHLCLKTRAVIDDLCFYLRSSAFIRGKKHAFTHLCLSVFLCGSLAVQAQIQTPEGDLPPPELAQRLKKLESELRCLVCQNQTLAESPAGLAGDLRREVRSLVEQGKTDGEIKTYLQARYGDFVLYKPPVDPKTYLLWFGPFGLLGGGGALMWWMARRRRLAAQVVAAPATGESDAKLRARRLLDGNDDGGKP